MVGVFGIVCELWEYEEVLCVWEYWVVLGFGVSF